MIHAEYHLGAKSGEFSPELPSSTNY